MFTVGTLSILTCIYYFRTYSHLTKTKELLAQCYCPVVYLSINCKKSLRFKHTHVRILGDIGLCSKLRLHYLTLDLVLNNATSI